MKLDHGFIMQLYYGIHNITAIFGIFIRRCSKCKILIFLSQHNIYCIFYMFIDRKERSIKSNKENLHSSD